MAQGIHIPSWAVKIGSGIFALLIPWLTYITLGVEAIKTNWVSQRDTNRQVLENLETIASFSGRIVALERQMERLEDQRYEK